MDLVIWALVITALFKCDSSLQKDEKASLPDGSPYFSLLYRGSNQQLCSRLSFKDLISQVQSFLLTMRSSSRSGDSTRGMMTWLRNSGVFSCFKTLFRVFNCPDSSAKLSRTEGLGVVRSHQNYFSL